MRDKLGLKRRLLLCTMQPKIKEKVVLLKKGKFWI